MPITPETPIERITEVREIAEGMESRRERSKDRQMPSPMPRRPPVRVRIMASIKNWVMIVLFLAPKALRRPISLVLSVTVTNMIFIIPIPPTTKEMAAIPERRVVKVPVTWEAVLRMSFWDIIIKSAWAGSTNLCLLSRKKPT